MVPTTPSRSLGTAVLLLAVIVIGIGVPAPAGASRPVASSSKLAIVAAENFWGSIVKQLAGDRADVTSIITNPATDPHTYEPRPSDARHFASADYVVENGIGYDAWAQKLLDANPDSHRKVLDVGKFLGVAAGGNPHQWYSPDAVAKFIIRVSTDLRTIDPAHAAYYRGREAAYETVALRTYDDLITTIRTRYAGTPVGATESIFTPLADDLKLDLITPERFLDAISEGSEPTAHDKATADAQIAQRRIKVLVYNSQNATPDVQALVKEAKAQRIPVTTVTETLVPSGATFQAWQAKQLRRLEAALARAVPTQTGNG